MPQAPSPNSSGMIADAEPYTSDRRFFGHPRGLSTLFFTEMWERFSYYGIRPLLVLFMTAALADGGFGFDRQTASAIVGIYAAGVYLASLPGGWIADRWLGLRRSIEYGAVLITLGHLAIALSSIFSKPAFFAGLVLIVMGPGLLKPNISAIVGDLYPAADARRDAGFSIFYMGINVGALIAPLITGALGERVGWHYGFGAAGVGMLIGLITYRMRANATLGPLGVLPSGTPEQQRTVKNVTMLLLALIALVMLLTMTGSLTINAVSVASRMRDVMVATAVAYFGYLFLFAGLDTIEKRRTADICVPSCVAALFWAAFE